ncbi:AAA family ATPase, partial [Patescibacteria group bacterium]|nr:AAA family ATPase [Patescibacteria group bacterium]
MFIERYYQDLENYFQSGKAVIIFGPRQVGKTTLLNQFLKRTNLKYRLDRGENIRLQNILSS